MVYGADNRAAKQWKTNQRSQCPVTVDQIEASARRMTGGALQSYTISQGKEIIMSGWKASGIIETIKKGSARLPSLDPSNDLDPLLTGSIA